MGDNICTVSDLNNMFEIYRFSRGMTDFANGSLEKLYRSHRSTFDHSLRTTSLVTRVCDIFGLNDENSSLLVFCAPSHDIGKLSLDSDILASSGKLTDDQFERQKIHPVLSYEILNSAGYHEAALIARDHHRPRYPIVDVPIHPLAKYLKFADIWAATIREDGKFSKGFPASDKMRICLEPRLHYMIDEVERCGGFNWAA